MKLRSLPTWALLLLLAGTSAPVAAEKPANLESLRQRLSFHCSYDAGPDADFARGDRQVYTFLQANPLKFEPGLSAEHLSVEETGGRYGGALRFAESRPQFPFYLAAKNLDYAANDWSGTVSFWLSLDPDKDLKPSTYVDPIHISDATPWNDASLWVDFSKDAPRFFSLGAFPDLEAWNPEKKEWSEIPESGRPRLMVRDPPFAAGRWTHVVFTFAGFNQGGREGVARLYFDGELQGEINGHRQVYSWDLATAAIRVGTNYVGRFDDLAVFDRALDAGEVKALYALPGGVAGLVALSRREASARTLHHPDLESPGR